MVERCLGRTGEVLRQRDGFRSKEQPLPTCGRCAAGRWTLAVNLFSPNQNAHNFFGFFQIWIQGSRCHTGNTRVSARNPSAYGNAERYKSSASDIIIKVSSNLTCREFHVPFYSQRLHLGSCLAVGCRKGSGSHGARCLPRLSSSAARSRGDAAAARFCPIVVGSFWFRAAPAPSISLRLQNFGRTDKTLISTPCHCLATLGHRR